MRRARAAAQEAARAEAAADAAAAGAGGEAAARDAGELAAAAGAKEAACRALLHELRFKKHAAAEAGALPLCARPPCACWCPNARGARCELRAGTPSA